MGCVVGRLVCAAHGATFPLPLTRWHPVRRTLDSGQLGRRALFLSGE
jgi:hypothetical protein